MNFFSEEQILKIHSSLIAKTGGIDGVRDYNLLDFKLKINISNLRRERIISINFR